MNQTTSHSNSQQSSSRKILVCHVAIRLGIPERTVRDRAKKGMLPAEKRGMKIWVFDPKKIEQYIQRRLMGK